MEPPIQAPNLRSIGVGAALTRNFIVWNKIYNTKHY